MTKNGMHFASGYKQEMSKNFNIQSGWPQRCRI